LVRAASRLKPVDPLRPATYSKLFGLLAATGMRRSEALNLLDDDVGPDGQRLVIRLTKFLKSRQLPLYPSTASALLTYRGQRNQQWPRTPARPFFVGRTGMPQPGATLHSVFSGLRRSLGSTIFVIPSRCAACSAGRKRACRSSRPCSGCVLILVTARLRIPIGISPACQS
jgi:integrase